MDVICEMFQNEAYQPIAIACSILMAIYFIAKVVVALYTAAKTKNLSSLKNIMLEVLKMSGKFVQDFTGSNLKDEYRYNDSTGEIVPTGQKIDVQQEIDSYKTTSFECAIESLMPAENEQVVMLKKRNAAHTRLDEMTELINTANQYRELFGMDAGASVNDVYARVQAECDNQKKAYENYLAKLRNLEVVEDAKKTE